VAGLKVNQAKKIKKISKEILTPNANIIGSGKYSNLNK